MLKNDVIQILVHLPCIIPSIAEGKSSVSGNVTFRSLQTGKTSQFEIHPTSFPSTCPVRFFYHNRDYITAIKGY
jgi:hypothetical protein